MSYIFPTYFDDFRPRRVTPGEPYKPFFSFGENVKEAPSNKEGRGVVSHTKDELVINVAGFSLENIVVYTKDNRLFVELMEAGEVVEVYEALLNSPAYEVEHINGLIVLEYIEDDKVFIEL